MKKGILYFLLIVSTALFIYNCAESIQKPDNGPIENEIIDVNTDISFGTFTLKTGINCGPLSTQLDHNYTTIYKQLGIEIIRTHDYYGPCDWYTIFPTWENDENNPESYNFQSTDQIINYIINNGFEVLFRLGPSWNDPIYEYNNDPPGTLRDNQGNITHIADHTDFLKFAAICRNIVRHYNEGWGEGYRYNIRRWEIWNEPSLSNQFWSGTHLQFYDMFGTVFSNLKEYNQDLIVGGPGLAGHSSEEYETELLEYCKNNNINIDYFSWHNYGSQGGDQENANQSPNVLGARADIVRNRMDDNGFFSSSSICTEWNADHGERNYTDTGKGAAFFGGALILMEMKGIKESYLYRGDNHPLGIFRDSTVLKTGAYVLKKWKMLSEGNKRIQNTFPNNEELYIISSAKKDDSAFYVLLSNFSETGQSLILQIHNVNTDNRPDWFKTEWETSDYRKNEIVSGPDQISMTGQIFRIEVSLLPESVKLLKIHKTIKTPYNF